MLILIVDDDIDDREIFCDALKAIDPQISCIDFDRGFKAIDFLSTTIALPDFAFIDINMPMMNGYECVQKIRENNKLDKVQIIMYSTGFNPKDINEFAKIGIRNLIKPNKFTDLIESIKVLISYRESFLSEEKK